jgi:hypothetical protein
MDMGSKIEKVNCLLQSTKDSLQEVPSRKELNEHAAVMDKQIAQVQKVNTELTTTKEGYKF